MGILLLLASDSTKYVNTRQHPWEKMSFLKEKKEKKSLVSISGEVIHVVVAKKRATQTGDIIVIIFSRGLMVLLRDVVVSKLVIHFLFFKVPFLILMRRQ